MRNNLENKVKELQEFMENFLQGAYTPPTAVGPNSLSKNSIRAKSITGSMIDVGNLQAVSTKTGDLTADGDITVSGAVMSGKTSYSDTTNPGFWIGTDSGTPKIRVGNAAHTAGWTWDGSTLAIIGSVTATTGTIGGFTIGSTSLTAGSGTSSVGMSSAGGSSPSFFAGNATPTSAPFRVLPSGNLTAEAGTIAGITIDGILGLKLGTSTSTRGISTGSTAFYAGDSTPGSAPFRVSSTGALTATNATITGDVTATSGSFTGAVTATSGSFTGSITASTLTITGNATFSGGNLALPGSGSITSSILDINSGTFGGVTIDGTLDMASNGVIKSGATTVTAGTGYWLAGGTTPVFRIGEAVTAGNDYMYWNGTTLEVSGKLVFGTSSYLQSNAMRFGTSGTGNVIEWTNGTGPTGQIILETTNSKSELTLYPRTSTASNYTIGLHFHGGDTGTTSTGNGIGVQYINSSGTGVEVAPWFLRYDGTLLKLHAPGPIYPGNTAGVTAQSSRYIADNGTRLFIEGDIDFNSITASNPGNTAWTSRGFSADTGGYIKIWRNGTAYRIPAYADS